MVQRVLQEDTENTLLTYIQKYINILTMNKFASIYQPIIYTI